MQAWRPAVNSPDHGWSWPQLYLLMAAIMLGLWVITWCLPDPPCRHQPELDTTQYAYRLPGTRKLKLVKLMLGPFILILWGALSGAGIHWAQVPGWPLITQPPC